MALQEIYFERCNWPKLWDSQKWWHAFGFSKSREFLGHLKNCQLLIGDPAYRRPCVMECLLLPFYFHTLSIHQFTLLIFPVMCFLFVCCQGCRGVWACEEVGGEQFAIWFPASTNCWSAWCSVLAASSSYKNYNTACSNQWWICFRWDLSYPASSCWIYTEAYQHRQWVSVYMLGLLSLILLWTQHISFFLGSSSFFVSLFWVPYWGSPYTWYRYDFYSYVDSCHLLSLILSFWCLFNSISYFWMEIAILSL